MIYRNRVRGDLRMAESTHEYTSHYVQIYTHPLESTNRSRLNHFEFLGFALKKLHWVDNQIKPQNDNSYAPRKEDMCDRCHAHGSTCSPTHTSALVLTDSARSGAYAPGCPELALPTTSAARARMVAMATSSTGSLVNLDMTVSCEMEGTSTPVRLTSLIARRSAGTCSQR